MTVAMASPLPKLTQVTAITIAHWHAMVLFDLKAITTQQKVTT